MRRLRTDKVRQLGGIAGLLAFLFLVANIVGDDTDEKTLLWVIVGAAVTFLLGFGFAPAIVRRVRRERKGGSAAPRTTREARRDRH